MFERYVEKQIDEAKSREDVFNILEKASREVHESGDDVRIIKRLGIAGYNKIAELSSDRDHLDEFDINHIMEFSEGISAKDAIKPAAFYKAVAKKAESDLAAELAAEEEAKKAAASKVGFFGNALRVTAGAALVGVGLSLGYRLTSDGGQ